MAYSVTLYQNSSPVEKIGKSLSSGEGFSCLFKQDTSILNPVITLRTSSSNIPLYNYMYIQELSRYYFIDDIISVNNDTWEIHGHVDVLETYKTQILDNSAVIKRQQNLFNLYLDDPEARTYACEQIFTKKFPQTGFKKNLNYIIAVNGGV